MARPRRRDHGTAREGPARFVPCSQSGIRNLQGFKDMLVSAGTVFLEDSLWKSRCEDCLTPYRVRWTYFSAIAAGAMQPIPLYGGSGRGTSIRFRLLWGAAHPFLFLRYVVQKSPSPTRYGILLTICDLSTSVVSSAYLPSMTIDTIDSVHAVHAISLCPGRKFSKCFQIDLPQRAVFCCLQVNLWHTVPAYSSVSECTECFQPSGCA